MATSDAGGEDKAKVETAWSVAVERRELGVLLVDEDNVGLVLGSILV